MSGRAGRRIALALVALGVAAYFRWQSQAANGPFHDPDVLAYYDMLARGFRSGHLYLPMQPSAELMAQKNPWDPNLPASIRSQDMVYYRGHYYLYFGAAPAVLLFTPYLVVTGRDFPENLAVALLCFAGFLFSCGALLRVLDMAGARPAVPWLAVWFLALGICNATPYLLNRATVYEIPIASGFCCVAGGLFFLSGAVGPQARGWAAAASGAMFGLAVASRAHLVLAGAVALAALTVYCLRRRSRTWLAFAAGWCLVGIAIGAYNYERFGNPLEFGFRYQLAGPGQNRVELAAKNVAPGAYYMLLSAPHFSSVFPWVRMVFRFPFDSAERHPLPPEYFVEPTIGALWLAPFVLGALLIPGRRHKDARLIPAAALAMGVAVLLFLIPSHLATQRYEADFLPLLVFAAVANIALMNRRAPAAIACILIAWSAAANLGLGEQGPYDDFLKKHPERYVRLARRFPSSAETRVALNPSIRVRLAARLDEIGYRDPLVTIGQSHYCYFLFAQREAGGGFRIVGKSTESEVEQRIGAPGGVPVTIGLVYDAKSGDLSMSVNGSTVVNHTGKVVAAPAQVAIGENFADMGLTSRYFRGELKVLERTVGQP